LTSIADGVDNYPHLQLSCSCTTILRPKESCHAISTSRVPETIRNLAIKPKKSPQGQGLIYRRLWRGRPDFDTPTHIKAAIDAIMDGFTKMHARRRH
jgi:hypothetical protein